MRRNLRTLVVASNAFKNIVVGKFCISIKDLYRVRMALDFVNSSTNFLVFSFFLVN